MGMLTVSGYFTNLIKVSEFVKAEAVNAGLDASAVYAVDLSVEEACSNIIEHAYQGEGKGDIQVECQPIEDGLEIEISDWGKPFDPESIPPLQVNVPIEDVGTRGAGLFLMRRMMDDVKFEFLPEGGNRLTMIKRKKG